MGSSVHLCSGGKPYLILMGEDGSVDVTLAANITDTPRPDSQLVRIVTKALREKKRVWFWSFAVRANDPHISTERAKVTAWTIGWLHRPVPVYAADGENLTARTGKGG